MATSKQHRAAVSRPAPPPFDPSALPPELRAVYDAARAVVSAGDEPDSIGALDQLIRLRVTAKQAGWDQTIISYVSILGNSTAIEAG